MWPRRLVYGNTAAMAVTGMVIHCWHLIITFHKFTPVRTQCNLKCCASSMGHYAADGFMQTRSQSFQKIYDHVQLIQPGFVLLVSTCSTFGRRWIALGAEFMFRKGPRSARIRPTDC